jgi:seryl-tRNA synthetase
MRAQVKSLSAEVGKARKAGDTAKADELQATSRALGEDESKLAAEVTALEAELRDRMLRIPNTPDPAALVGTSEDDNKVVRGGELPDYAEHQRVPHWDIGVELGILDNERAVKVAGSMFVGLRGMGATMARALCQLALDRNADLYEEMRPPTMVLTDTLVGTGQLPKFADDAYHVERDDLWPIPTAEVPLTSWYRDEVLTEAELPKRLMAYSPCYRREAGSAGKDTRGLLRGHEFDKVEILALATPEQAQDLHEEITSRAIGTLEALGLPTRVLEICTGDLGQSHARQYDVEIFAPGADRWLEASSCSWFTDYQARRANIRYRAESGTAFVHTLNGSALAVPRVLAALLEHYRNADGSVSVPEVLIPYCRGVTKISPR